MDVNKTKKKEKHERGILVPQITIRKTGRRKSVCEI
jgi:hypothetical protein